MPYREAYKLWFEKSESSKAEPPAPSGGKLVPTTADIEGPFYKPGAPLTDVLKSTPDILIGGKVFNVFKNPVPSAVLDIWHADEKGDYDMEGYRYRCKLVTNAEGSYLFHTCMPGNYPISEHEFRCAHIHVKVVCTGYKSLTTQLYFPGDNFNSTDRWYNVARELTPIEGSRIRLFNFNFVLESTNEQGGSDAT